MAGPKVTFLGGVREIGGNKILVEDGPDRVLFDFGPSFSDRWEEFYINFLQPRSTSPVKDLLEFDLLPRLPGLYSREALHGADLPYQAPEIHGLFVSHAHFDHAGHLGLVDPEIPVYVGATTKQLLEAIETSTPTKYGTHDWRVVPDGTKARVGRIEVEGYPVDHSIPGATGYLIRTSAGTVVYTGDYRMHGPRAADTRAFLERAQAEKPVALITEGTRMGPDPRRNFTEEGVRSGVDDILVKNDRLAIVTCYPRDVDRLTTLYRAARAAGRDFVVPMKTAHLLSKVASLLGPDIPTPGRSKGVRVYQRPKKTTYKWERPFLDDAVDAGYVREHGSEILLSLDLPHFAELIDLRPPGGSPFIHSMSEPFSEDDVDDQVLHNWLDHFGLGFHQMHASGHCSASELRQIVERVAPARLFPVHTEHPEAFEGFGAPLVLPEKGVSLPLVP